MKKPLPFFSFQRSHRNKLGIQTAIVTLILVVIGIAVALTVASVVYSNIAAYSGRASIRVLEAKAYMQPGSTVIYFSVKVKNDGGAKLSSIQIQVSKTGSSWTSIGTVSVLEPGQEQTVSGAISLGEVSTGDYVLVKASGNTPQGTKVEDVIRIVVM